MISCVGRQVCWGSICSLGHNRGVWEWDESPWNLYLCTLPCLSLPLLISRLWALKRLRWALLALLTCPRQKANQPNNQPSQCNFTNLFLFPINYTVNRRGSNTSATFDEGNCTNDVAKPFIFSCVPLKSCQDRGSTFSFLPKNLRACTPSRASRARALLFLLILNRGPFFLQCIAYRFDSRRV